MNCNLYNTKSQCYRSYYARVTWRGLMASVLCGHKQAVSSLSCCLSSLTGEAGVATGVTGVATLSGRSIKPSCIICKLSAAVSLSPSASSIMRRMSGRRLPTLKFERKAALAPRRRAELICSRKLIRVVSTISTISARKSSSLYLAHRNGSACHRDYRIY